MNTKSLTITNVILIIAVIILFVMQFSGSKTINKEVEQPKEVVELDSAVVDEPVSLANFNVAFVNSDTVTKYSDYNVDVSSFLKTEQASAEYRLKKMRKDLEKDVEYFKVNQAVMSQGEAQRRYNEMAEKEQALVLEQQKISERYVSKENKAMMEYVYGTNEFMQKIGQELGYDYILSYRVGGSMLYANPELDITDKVIELLNAEYKKSKETEQPSVEK